MGLDLDGSITTGPITAQISYETEKQHVWFWMWVVANVHPGPGPVSICRDVQSQKSGSRRGSTGRMRFPNEESWVMKKPEECTWACCRAAFCWAAMCCCSALSLASFRLGLVDRGMLAPGLFMDWFCNSRLFSLSSSARMATRVLFWKPGPGGLAAMSAYQRRAERIKASVHEGDWCRC